MSTSDDWVTHLARERRPANTVAAARRVMRSLPHADTATREDVEAWWASRAHLSPATRSNDLHHQQGKGTTMHRLLSLAAVLALAACSSAAPTAATTPTPSAAVITADPTPSATATATATPTPTVWTKTEAAAQYLALVKPPNDARIALNAQVDAHPKDPKPLPAIESPRRLSRALSRDSRTDQQGCLSTTLRRRASLSGHLRSSVPYGVP